MFIDKAKITVKSGKGGDGSIAFHREKYIEYGGPSGGNGGRGGSIYFKAIGEASTLINYRHARKVVADDGGKGDKENRYGRKAKDVILEVPVGTVIFQEPEHILIADLSEVGKTVLVCKGGRGGRGNACFKSPRNPCPRVAENGLPGEEKVLTLELKLLADVGLVGLPSVGKSTLLSVISDARPEIADYPFTTITPNLGVVYLENSSFVVADLPGLIEGAHNGRGLGLTFLRHIERCRVLIHVLDMEHEDPLNDFEVINNELKSYGFNLLDRPMLVVCSKVEDEETKNKYESVKKALEGKYDVMSISALVHDGIQKMLYKINEMLETAPQIVMCDEVEQKVKVYDAHKDLGDEFKILKEGPHKFHIVGERVERAYSLINISTDEGLMKLISFLRKIGVDQKLHEMNAQDGDTVVLCDYEFEYYN